MDGELGGGKLMQSYPSQLVHLPPWTQDQPARLQLAWEQQEAAARRLHRHLQRDLLLRLPRRLHALPQDLPHSALTQVARLRMLASCIPV